eukprot:Gb_33818 [translate_table: standard]
MARIDVVHGGGAKAGRGRGVVSVSNPLSSSCSITKTVNGSHGFTIRDTLWAKEWRWENILRASLSAWELTSGRFISIRMGKTRRTILQEDKFHIHFDCALESGPYTLKYTSLSSFAELLDASPPLAKLLYTHPIKFLPLFDEATRLGQVIPHMVTFRDPEIAKRACIDPSLVIDGRRAYYNIASLDCPCSLMLSKALMRIVTSVVPKMKLGFNLSKGGRSEFYFEEGCYLE